MIENLKLRQLRCAVLLGFSRSATEFSAAEICCSAAQRSAADFSAVKTFCSAAQRVSSAAKICCNAAGFPLRCAAFPADAAQLAQCCYSCGSHMDLGKLEFKGQSG